MQKAQQQTLARSVRTHDDRASTLLDCQVDPINESVCTHAIHELTNVERKQGLSNIARYSLGLQDLYGARHRRYWMY